MLAQDYAKALFELGPDPKYLAGLKATLARRGHSKLLPRVLSEYEKLVLAKTRLEHYKQVTPEKERTRILLELYRKLTHV